MRDFELFQFLGFPLLFIIPLIFLVPICYFLNVKELNEKISDLEVQYSRLSNEYEDTKRLQEILVGNATDSKQVKEVYQVELHKFIDDLKIKLGERYVTYPKTFEVVEDTAMSYLKQHVLSKGNLYNHNSDFQNCYNEIQKNGLIEIEEEEAFTERMRLKTLPDRMKHQISNIGFYLRLIDHEILDREIYEPKAYDSDVDLYLKDKVIDDYLLFDDYGGIARKYPDIEDELDEFSKKLDAAIAVNKFENTY